MDLLEAGTAAASLWIHLPATLIIIARDAQIPKPVSGIDTDTWVEFSACASKIL